MKKLLLVEDDQSLGETLCERLQKEDYAVSWVENLGDAEVKTNKDNFDLIILDVNLPDGSGFDFARKVRSERPTPFIFITALNSAEHRLEGYEIGAEEFIPKPFHLKELLMRIRHVLDTHAELSEVRARDCTIDLNAQAIIKSDGSKEFPQARDFRLLKMLIQSTPRILSRDQILDEVWGEDKYPSHRTVDNAIVRLRQAIGDVDGSLIRSVRGVGYQWVGGVSNE
jgi:two-component system, OmpR family, phosphate regulon response regulator PhoB